MDLIQQLTKRAGSLRKAADRLGVSVSYLSYVNAGKRKASARLLRALVREFPELEPFVLEYLRGNYKKGDRAD